MSVLLAGYAALPAKAFQPAPHGPSADRVPEANPARPTITNPAHIPPPGYLQFEQGLLQANDSPSLRRQFSGVQTTKLSFSHYVMGQISSQPIARSALSTTESSSDTGDLILGGQVLFDDKNEGRSRTPTIALAYNRRIRTGTSPDLDIGSFSENILLLGSGTLYGIHYDTNFVVAEQSDGRVRRAQYGKTLSLTRQFTPRWAVTGEIWHFTQPLVSSTRSGADSPRSNAAGVLANVGLTLRPNLVLDAGMLRGLTPTSTAWQSFAGITYLLPHRLWQGGRR